MIRALLIGCGNIGGGYDFNDPQKVWTHAKAYSLHKGIELTVYDQEKEKAIQIADKYNARVLEQITDDSFSAYQIVSITTPTPTHFTYLQKALQAKVAVVICEKPIVDKTEHLTQLQDLYLSSSSKVLVNYIRRFQPGYKKAKLKILQLRQEQVLCGVIVKYKRGFLNNASHAIDLLQFIFDVPFELKGFQQITSTFDVFNYDPTITGSCLYLDCPVSFAGMANISYPVFEIELFFSASKVVICHSGDEIRYYKEKSGDWCEITEERQSRLLEKYMVPVIGTAVDLSHGVGEDNFKSSLEINKAVLNIIEPLKKKSNATFSN